MASMWQNLSHSKLLVFLALALALVAVIWSQTASTAFAHQGSITIRKVDPQGNLLAGSTFSITPNPFDCYAGNDFPRARTVLDNNPTLFIVDNENPILLAFENLAYEVPGDLDSTDGILQIDGVCAPESGDPPIEYIITEVEAPAGYLLDTNPQSAIIAKDGDTTELTFVNAPEQQNGGGEGCTPGFWKQPHHFEFWTTYAPGDSFDDVFGVTFSFGGTLLEALQRGGGGEVALGRHVVAALLNFTSPDVDYGFTTAQVIALVQDAYYTGDFEDVKDLLEDEIELGCNIKDDEDDKDRDEDDKERDEDKHKDKDKKGPPSFVKDFLSKIFG